MLGSRGLACACLWLLVSAWMAPSVGAQIGTAVLVGDVVDQGSAAVPGATVTVQALGTGLSRTAVTGQDGAYSVLGLAPGAYRVRVELSGFRPLTREGIQLATGETVRLDVQLEVGGVTEAITVTADAPLLRSEADLLSPELRAWSPRSISGLSQSSVELGMRWPRPCG